MSYLFMLYTHFSIDLFPPPPILGSQYIGIIKPLWFKTFEYHGHLSFVINFAYGISPI